MLCCKIKIPRLLEGTTEIFLNYLLAHYNETEPHVSAMAFVFDVPNRFPDEIVSYTFALICALI